MQRQLVRATLACTLLLILLCLAWELRLAPLRPGGSWLALKVLPLLLAVRGLANAKRYTYQWMSLCVWLYFSEGLVRATSEKGLSVTLAVIETMLALALFASCAAYARISAPSRIVASRASN
jgi:uncharacterized membrane protein